MDPGTMLLAVLTVGGVGLTFGVLIALANSRLKVWEDPRIDEVADMLPGANCGACGFAGCRAFAEAVIGGDTPPATCTVMGPEDTADVATYLGVDAGSVDKKIARLLCAGGSDVAHRRATYHGLESCGAAVAVGGGGKACAWGCVGLADCAVACTFGAIVMSDVDLPIVDPELCTSCGDCVDACPLDLFAIMPVDHRLIVQCKNLLSSDDATDVCSVACNACGRCAADAPDLITMENGLAVIDYGRAELANPDAIARCPTGAIVWLEGEQQFAEQNLLAGSEAS